MEKTRGLPYKWLALITVAIGSYMGTLDASIVNISLPRLTRVFNTDASSVLWVSVIYLLIGVSLMFTFGRIGDALGRKRIYVLGMALFTAGLTLCALSQNLTQLVLARVIQAIGSAGTVSISTAIVTAAFPNQERGKALGILGAVISAGLLSGPVFGGLLLDLLDWRSIFYVRIPVGVIGLVMAVWLLREQKAGNARLQFDWAGAIALSLGLACMLLFFNLGGKAGFGAPYVLALAAGAVLLLGLFVVFERRAAQPVLDLNLFRNRLFAGANISLVLMFVAVTANTFLMPFYFIEGLGYAAAKTGLLYAVISTTSLIVGPFSGWLSDRIGYRVLCSVGLAFMSLGLFLLSRLTVDATVTTIVPRLAVMGFGLGLFSSPNNSSIMGSVPHDKLSTGSAMIATVRQVGISSGMAIAGAIFVSRQAMHVARLNAAGSGGDAERLALVAAYQDALLIAAVVCAVGIIASMVWGSVHPDALAGRPEPVR